MCYLSVWGVEPVVTHQTSWLESTGVCGVWQDCGILLAMHELCCTACLVHQLLHSGYIEHEDGQVSDASPLPDALCNMQQRITGQLWHKL